MKITSIEIYPKGTIPLVPYEPPPPTPEPPPVILGSEEHYYINSMSMNQELPGTIHESYSDAANGTTGSKYISSAQDESLVVGQSFAHYTAPPSYPYENDGWQCFETFIDFDTTDITSSNLLVTLRVYISACQIQIDQDLLVALYDWGGGPVNASDWRTPAQLSALTPIGTAPITNAMTGTIEIAIDPDALVLGGHTRVILYTSQLRDGISPGGPGPTGSSHSFLDDIFLEPASGNYPAKSPALLYRPVLPPPSIPSVTGISPSSGSTVGGTSVTVTGANFTGVTAVTVAGVSASFSVINSTTLTVTTPAHAAGTVDIRVQNADGVSSIVPADKFTYISPPVSAPTITGISPSSGTTAGGTLITITGTNFTEVVDVTIDGSSVSYTVVNNTTITAVTPAHSAATVDVRVQNSAGTSAIVVADQFIFVAPPPAAPTVTGVSPNSGTTAGGTSITITGTNFVGVTNVTIAGVSVTFTVVNSTTITAVTSSHAAGTVDVRVVNADGTSPIVTADHFTFVSPAPAVPTVTAISPTSGTTAGGTLVTVTGTSFTGATAVTIAGVTVSGFSVVNSTTITFTTPSHAAGTVDIRVQNVSGTSAITTADRFTYVTPSTTLPSPVGPVAPITGPIVSDTGLASSYSSTYLTLDQKFRYLWDAGFHTAQDLQIGAAICIAESSSNVGCRNWHPEYGFRPLAESPIHLLVTPPAKAWNPAGNTSGQIMRSDRGAWQISDHWYPQYTDAMCDDPATAARIVYLIKTQIAGGWNQWDTYAGGDYQGLVTLAQAQAWINANT